MPERKYILNCIFQTFWNIRITVSVSSKTDKYTIVNDGNKLSLPDNFFSQNPKSWLTEDWNPNLPLKTFDTKRYGWESLCKESHLPDLFPSSNELPKYSSDEDTHHLDLDIFGASFYMLSRYEEIVSTVTDRHSRFPFSESIASKGGLVSRPIVNEYLEILWECLSKLSPRLKRKPREFKINLSHDIDRPQFLNDAKQGTAGNRLALYEKLLSLAENHKLTSAFYFLTAVTKPEIDADYSLEDDDIKNLLILINQNGHEIGLHPSYNTFDNSEQTRKEWLLLRNSCERLNIDQEIWGGRQHYLRFETPQTWRNWESAGMNYDSTLGFAEHPGFRCGICYEYPVFDLTNSVKLNLLERPLVWMDDSLLSKLYMGFEVGSEEAISYTLALKETCRKYNGDFNLLYHDNYLAETAHFQFLEEIIAS